MQRLGNNVPGSSRADISSFNIWCSEGDDYEECSLPGCDAA